MHKLDREIGNKDTHQIFVGKSLEKRLLPGYVSRKFKYVLIVRVVRIASVRPWFYRCSGFGLTSHEDEKCRTVIRKSGRRLDYNIKIYLRAALGKTTRSWK